jgi:hypothetical protein
MFQYNNNNIKLNLIIQLLGTYLQTIPGRYDSLPCFMWSALRTFGPITEFSSTKSPVQNSVKLNRISIKQRLWLYLDNNSLNQVWYEPTDYDLTVLIDICHHFGCLPVLSIIFLISSHFSHLQRLSLMAKIADFRPQILLSPRLSFLSPHRGFKSFFACSYPRIFVSSSLTNSSPIDVSHLPSVASERTGFRGGFCGD